MRERGVTYAALFGSRAHGDNRPNNDTDITIDIDPEMETSVYDYVCLKRYIAALFDGRVDVVTRDALKPYVRPVCLRRGRSNINESARFVMTGLVPQALS